VSATPILEVDRLCVDYQTPDGPFRAVDEVSFELRRGESIGIVGESGCGKSTVGHALMRLLPGDAVIAGTIRLEGSDLATLPYDSLLRQRWRRIAMIFQSAMNAFNPVVPVGRQIIEPMVLHRVVDGRGQARQRARELFDLVGLPADRLNAYPHELSGGMRQRAIMAMSLACNPSVLIADEPTTALDVVVQDQIFLRLAELKRQFGLSIVLVSHDIGLIAENCDRVGVMYAGRLVEFGATADVLRRPRHPYSAVLSRATPSLAAGTRDLVALPGAPPGHGATRKGCVFVARCPLAIDDCRHTAPPTKEVDGRLAACHLADQVEAGDVAGRLSRFTAPPSASPADPVLVADGVSRHFDLGGLHLFGGRRTLTAVDGVDLALAPGEVVGLIGESGCGKTTLGMMLTGLEETSEGRIEVNGESWSAARGRSERALRRSVQVIFQDPYESLNPRMRVADTLEEPLIAHGIGDRAERRRSVEAMLDRVGLTPARSFARRFPAQLSGGQRQRVAIARAMIVGPRVVIADEPLSMLDASVKAGIMSLLADFKRDGVAILVVTHDLSIARYLCDRIAVMYLGRIVELGLAADVIDRPRHPYTRLLLDSVPDPFSDRSNRRLLPSAEPPNPAQRPTGCAFHPRCAYSVERCRAEPPVLEAIQSSQAACWRAREIDLSPASGEIAPLRFGAP